MIIKCGPELFACLRDPESREGLQELTKCGDKNSKRVQNQIKELQHMEVPEDSDICSARILDEYPTKQLASFSRSAVIKCANMYKDDDVTPQKPISFNNPPLKMNLNEHSGKWWRTHTDSWDNWDCSFMNFVEATDGDWKLHIEYQVKTAMRGLIRRQLAEYIAAHGIEERQFGTTLVMWDTETTEVWKLLHKTDDARMFAICAKTQIPRPRIDNIFLIVSRTPELSEPSLKEMKVAANERGINWNNFFELKNNNCNNDIPIIPF
ncbi:MAG: hypothetical protein OCD02_09255 [Spirochaetaceae bacterium]